MELSFLVILIILILFFIIKQHKRDCIECKLRFVIVLGIVLFLYETYMTLTHNKYKSNSNSNSNTNTNIKVI